MTLVTEPRAAETSESRFQFFLDSVDTDAKTTNETGETRWLDAARPCDDA